MKLYANATGGNVRRVLIYLAEKGLKIERVDVDLAAKAHKTPEFIAKNPAGLVPVLELDDGSYLPESSAIMEYIEELNPEPSLIGHTAEKRARVRAVERIAGDLAVLALIYYEHAHPFFAPRLKQNPAIAEAVRPKVGAQLAVLEKHLGDKPFLAGDAVTIADCTLFPLFQTCRVVLKDPFGEGLPGLNAWYARFEKRPSTAY